MALSGCPDGDLKSPPFPCPRGICTLHVSLPLLKVTSHQVKPRKTPFIRPMHIPNFIFLINLLTLALSKT